MDCASIKLLTQDLLDSIATQAASSPRLRQNYNFHDQPSEKVQRFLNVLQPHTYVRPHRHRRSTGVNGFEFFLVIQGELGMIVFDEQGQIIYQAQIGAHGTRGIELPEGTYHTLVSLAPNTTILELKEGPYDPRTDKEFLTLFPLEGSPAAQTQVEEWQSCFYAPMTSGRSETIAPDTR